MTWESLSPGKDQAPGRINPLLVEWKGGSLASLFYGGLD